VTRILKTLSSEGKWLRLVKRGNHRTGRASLYLLAPELVQHSAVNIWGASPPEYHPLPTYHLPTYHSHEENMNISMTFTEFLHVLEDIRKPQSEQGTAQVRHLRLIAGGDESPDESRRESRKVSRRDTGGES
jgi:hypothetical protein